MSQKNARIRKQFAIWRKWRLFFLCVLVSVDVMAIEVLIKFNLFVLENRMQKSANEFYEVRRIGLNPRQMAIIYGCLLQLQEISAMQEILIARCVLFILFLLSAILCNDLFVILQKHGARMKCSACNVVAHHNCIGVLIDRIRFTCKPTFRDVGIRQYREQTCIHHHWVHRRSEKGKCRQCGKVFVVFFHPHFFYYGNSKTKLDFKINTSRKLF